MSLISPSLGTVLTSTSTTLLLLLPVSGEGGPGLECLQQAVHHSGLGVLQGERDQRLLLGIPLRFILRDDSIR